MTSIQPYKATGAFRNKRLKTSKLKHYNTDITVNEMGVPHEDSSHVDFTNSRINISLCNIPKYDFSDPSTVGNRKGNVLRVHSVEVMGRIVCHPEWIRIVMYVPKNLNRDPISLKAIPYSLDKGINDDEHWVLHDELRYVGGSAQPLSEGSDVVYHYGSTAEHRTFFFKYRFSIPMTIRYIDIPDGVPPFETVNNDIRLAAYVQGGPTYDTGIQFYGHSKVWFSDD